MRRTAISRSSGSPASAARLPGEDGRGALPLPLYRQASAPAKRALVSRIRPALFLWPAGSDSWQNAGARTCPTRACHGLPDDHSRRALPFRRPARGLRPGQRGKVRRPTRRHRRALRARARRRQAASWPTCPWARSSISPLIDPDQDDVSRLLLDTLDHDALRPLRCLTVGEFREQLLDDAVGEDEVRALQPAILPEMAAAVAKLMSNKDLVLAASEDPQRHALPQHDGAARRARHPRAAQPSRRRPRRHPAGRRGRAAVRLRRCRPRRQPGHRIGGRRGSHPARPGSPHRNLPGADAGVLPGPHHHPARLSGTRRAGGPALSVDRRHAGGQRQLRRQPGSAARGPRARPGKPSAARGGAGSATT